MEARAKKRRKAKDLEQLGDGGVVSHWGCGALAGLCAPAFVLRPVALVVE